MKQNKKRVGKMVMTAVLLILGAANIFPFIFMLSASFKPLNEIFVYPVKLIPEHFITIIKKFFQPSTALYAGILIRLLWLEPYWC